MKTTIVTKGKHGIFHIHRFSAASNEHKILKGRGKKPFEPLFKKSLYATYRNVVKCSCGEVRLIEEHGLI